MKNNGKPVNLRFSIDTPISQKTLAVQTGDYRNPPNEIYMFYFDSVQDLEELLDKLVDLREDFYNEYL